MATRLLFVATLAATLSAQPDLTRTLLEPTADFMSRPLSRDARGRIYVLQHNKIVRLVPGSNTPQVFTYTNAPLMARSLRVTAAGIVYVAGWQANPNALGPSECGDMPLLGVPLHSAAATYWIKKLDLSPVNPDPAPAVIGAICALADGPQRTDFGDLELNPAGDRLYWYGHTTGRASFNFTRTFGPDPVAGVTNAWIVEMDTNFNALNAVRLGPVDRLHALAVDATGRIAVSGATSSTSFPLRGNLTAPSAPSQADAFVSVFSPGFTQLLLSTRQGGSQPDTATHVAFDAGGSLYFAGTTSSFNLPTINAHQPAFGGGESDLMVGRIAPSLDRMDFLTYLGGAGRDAARFSVNPASGDLYFAGFDDTFTPASDSLPAINALTGPVNKAFAGHLSAEGRVDYFTRLPAAHQLAAPIDLLATAGGFITVGYPDNALPGIGADILLELRDPSTDLVLTQGPTTTLPFTAAPFFTTFTVTNTGSKGAGGLSFTASLPFQPWGNHYAGATSSEGSCQVTDRQVTCALKQLAPGNPGWRVTLRTIANSPGTARVRAATADPDLDDNHN